jgi:arsenate reductase (thioredoxin)
MPDITPALLPYINTVLDEPINEKRQSSLQPLISYIEEKNSAGEETRLVFICTHNSRRSQFAQIWAHLAVTFFNIKNIHCYSGGTEVTAFNINAAEALRRTGTEMSVSGNAPNYYYEVSFSPSVNPVILFSKLWSDPSNPSSGFAAIMTCSQADKNCPFIPGAEARIPVTYEDPKKYDGTSRQSMMYDQRCFQIASEMFFVFKTIKSSLPK